MKKIKLAVFVFTASLMVTSCTSKINTMSKNSTPFPGMTVSRADYKLSKDVTDNVTVKEWSAFFGYLNGVKTVGEDKKVLRQGIVSGYGLDKASQVAVYKMLEKNPEFDYLTNIRVKKEFTKKWLFLFTKYESQIEVTAKGITLKADK